MKSNKERRQEIFENVIPPTGTKAYNDLVKTLKKAETPEIRDFMKKSLEKATLSLESQILSSCEMVTEKSLRHFLQEFNTRAWKHGLRSMPIMFNIMEAFFNYKKPEIYFELIEEEDYLISFFDFVDFITSKDFESRKELIDENITQDIIYNFNIGEDMFEIDFKTDDGDQFVIAGVSIIRRNSEITVLVTTGKLENNDRLEAENYLTFTSENPNKVALTEELRQKVSTEGIEFEYLDENKKYIKVLVGSRIDLETMTIDARYIAKETTASFKITTDEIDGFLNTNGEFINDNFKEIYEISRKSVEKYAPIFEVIMKYSLFLRPAVGNN